MYLFRGLKLFPIIGIGGGSLNLNIIKDIPALSFDEILENPERGINISTSQFLFKFEVGIDYLLKIAEDKVEQAGSLFGIRAGYTFSPHRSNWMMNDLEILGAPETGITGPFIHFMFGGFGMNKSQ